MARRDELKAHIRENKLTFAVYLILRGLILVAMTVSFLRGNYENVFICVLTLVLFLVPAFIEKNLGINLPSVLQIVVMLFIFCAEILGEMRYYYIKFEHWDTMLHTVNGFLFAAVGFALVDILNQNHKIKFELSPVYVAVVAFCFSMTVGVLWEFFECGCDLLLHTDMQKDTVVHYISSVLLDQTQTNTPVIIDGINEVAVNGQPLAVDGYIDLGLLDTMKDLLVNFIGAVVFSFIGFFYIKGRGRGRIASQFIPTVDERE